MASKFGMHENVVPLLIPLDRTATAAATPWVDLKTAHDMTFLVYYGALTGGSTGDLVTVTVEAATVADSAGEAAVAFSYRLSGATGANSWGAVTAATTSGVTLAENADDNKILLVAIDPAAIAGAKADARWVRLVLTPAANYAASTGCVIGVISPRYKGASMTSAT